jgi:hypothetical protein
LLRTIQLQKIDNPIAKLTTIQDPQFLQHVKELNHCLEELWNQLDHPCYHNKTFIVDSKCTFQLKGLCYSFDVNEDPITYEEAIVDPSGRMPCSRNMMNYYKERNLGVAKFTYKQKTNYQQVNL